MAKVIRNAHRRSTAKSGNNKITFHYIKSNTMVTLYADGGYGGVSPRGLISLALYNERAPIPQEEEAEVSSEGKVVSSRKTKTKVGLIRQIDAELFLTPDAARSIGTWLLEKATQADDLRAKSNEVAAKRGKEDGNGAK